MFLIIHINRINYFNLYIYLISVISFFNNIESFLIINFLNSLLFLNSKNTFFLNIFKYIAFLFLTLISIYISIIIFKLFFDFDFSIYKNIIIGTSNGFARSFPVIDNFSLTIFVIVSHSCSLIIYDFKNLIFKKNVLNNKKIINIFLSIIILYFSIFYFRRGYNTVHTDLIFLFYFILFIQQINFLLKFIIKRKKLNKLIFYSVNFDYLNVYFLKFDYFNYYNVKRLKILSIKIFFIFIIFFSTISKEYIVKNSSFDKFQIKDLNSIVAKKNANILLFQLNNILNNEIEINTFSKSKILSDINNLSKSLKTDNTKLIIDDTDTLLQSSYVLDYSLNKLLINDPLKEVNNFFSDNEIQTVFTGYNYHKNKIDYDYVFGVTRGSNILSPKFKLPIEYRDNLIQYSNIFPNFDIFTNSTFNNIAGFNIPNLDFSIIKMKADFLKNKNFYYISDYSFFISLYNKEIPDFYFMDPFNDLLTKDAFNNFIKKLGESKTIIAIDCVPHMGNVRGKNFYNLFVNRLIKSEYYVREICTKEGFTILKKKL